MPIIKKNFFFFTTARIILDDDALSEALKERRYSYITGLSYDGALDATGIASVRSKKTPILKLQGKDDDALLMQCNETTRNEIRRTMKMPELVFHIPEKNEKKVYELYQYFEDIGGRPIRTRGYFKESLLAGAWRGDTLLAAVICYDARPYVRVNAIVSLRNEDAELRKLVSYSTRRLIFELARYARDNGYQLLDLGGVNLEDPAKKGITAFKMSFGGELVDEYTYTFKSSLFRHAYSFFYKGR